MNIFDVFGRHDYITKKMFGHKIYRSKARKSRVALHRRGERGTMPGGYGGVKPNPRYWMERGRELF